MNRATDPRLHTMPTRPANTLRSCNWPNGPALPALRFGRENHASFEGKSTRPGVYKCNACEKPFTVTVGTVMEDSKIPLRQVAAGVRAGERLQKKGFFSAPAASFAWYYVQVGLVHAPSYPRSDEAGYDKSRWAAWAMTLRRTRLTSDATSRFRRAPHRYPPYERGCVACGPENGRCAQLPCD